MPLAARKRPAPDHAALLAAVEERFTPGETRPSGVAAAGEERRAGKARPGGWLLASHVAVAAGILALCAVSGAPLSWPSILSVFALAVSLGFLVHRPLLLELAAMRREVAQERRVACALALSEERMRTLVEGTDVILWEFDPEQARFTYISPQAQRLGYPLERWYEAGFWMSILHPEDREDTIRECQQAVEQRRDHRMQYRFVRADGSEQWVDDVVTVDVRPDGRVALRGLFFDMTQTKRTEAILVEASRAVEEERERLQLALLGGELGMWDWRPRSGQLFFDWRWAEMLGEPIDSAMLRTAEWRRRIHPDDLPELKAALAPHLEGLAPLYEATFRMRHKNGSWRWIQSRGKLVERDEHGRPSRVVGTHSDVTVQKERELELARLRDAAEQASRSKSEFLANMSHEIRTPLTAILGYADLLVEDERYATDARLREQTVATIRGAGQHLLTVINDILDLSKIEAGAMTVEAVETDLPRLLTEVESVMLSRARGKGVELAVVLETPIPARISSDPTRLRQILINLVGNAAKFTEQGAVVVRARVSEGSPGRLCLEVEDTGPGLTCEQAQQLFQPFGQADSSITRRFGGTGLGLSICRRLARLMGGEVSLLWTEPGVGSRFLLDLPLVAVAQAELVTDLGPARSARDSGARRELSAVHGRVLLAEDGPVNQRLLHTLLTRAGAEVEVVANGLEALAAIERARSQGRPHDLLLTDIQMPEMDGYTLTRTLRERGSSLAIVALTAHAMAEDRERCIAAGCNAYVSKPIEQAKLLEVCARWIGRSVPAGT